MKQQRRLDVGHRRRIFWLCPIIGDTGGEIRRIDGKLVHGATAPAEPNGADLAVAGFVAFQESHCGDTIGDRLRRVELAEHSACLLLVGRRSAERRQIVRGKRHEAFQRDPPCHILDVRVEAAVLVDDDHRSELAAAVGRLHQIALHVAAGARPGDILGLQPRVVFRHDRRARRIGCQKRRDCRGSSTDPASFDSFSMKPRRSSVRCVYSSYASIIAWVMAGVVIARSHVRIRPIKDRRRRLPVQSRFVDLPDFRQHEATHNLFCCGRQKNCSMVRLLFGFGGILPMVLLTRREIVLGGLAFCGAGVTHSPAFAQASSYFAGTAVDNSVTFRRPTSPRSTGSGTGRW